MYKVESSFGTEATVDSYFGRYTNSTFTPSNNIIEDYDAGERKVQNLMLGGFSGRGNVNFDLIDFTPFQYIIGARTGAGTSGDPYVYSTGNSLSSVTIEVGFDGTTDVNWTYIGCKCNSASLSFRKGEPIRVRSEWIYKTEKEDSTLVSYTAPTSSPFIYSQGALERNDSNIVGIQSGSITISNNLIPDDNGFERLTTDLLVGQSKIGFEFTVNLDSSHATTLISDFYGQAAGSGPITSGTGILTGATIDLELDNGGVRDVTLALSVATINELGRPHDIGNNMVSMTVSGTAKTISVSEQTS